MKKQTVQTPHWVSLTGQETKAEPRKVQASSEKKQGQNQTKRF